MADFLVVVSHYAVCYLHILLAFRFYPMRKDDFLTYMFFIYVIGWAVMHGLYGTELLWEAMGWFTPFYFVSVFISYVLVFFFLAMYIPLFIGELNVQTENPNPIARVLKPISDNARSLFFLSLLGCCGYTIWMAANIQPLEQWRGQYGNMPALFSMVALVSLWMVMYLSGLRPSGEYWKGAGYGVRIIMILWMFMYLFTLYWDEYWSIFPITQTLAFSFVISWYRFRLKFLDLILNQAVRILVMVALVCGFGYWVSPEAFQFAPIQQFLLLLVYTLTSVVLVVTAGRGFARLWAPSKKVLASIHDELSQRLAGCDNARVAIRETESFIATTFLCDVSINRECEFKPENIINLTGEPAIELKLGYMRGWIPWLSQASASARSAGLLLQSQLQIQQFHDHSIRAEELLTLTARAELDAMRAQIRPHFLFNTLNSIHSFVRDDPEKAEQVIEQLSALMRSVLSSPDEDLITLQYEMDTVRNYLSIEYARYGERLKYEIQVPEALSGWKIPPFSVQPLVENVIKHAVDAQFEPVNLVIKAVDSSSKLIIEVVDDGPGLLDVKEGLGLATKNIKERLDRLYGSEANLGLQTNHSGGVTATLCVPADSNY